MIRGRIRLPGLREDLDLAPSQRLAEAAWILGGRNACAEEGEDAVLDRSIELAEIPGGPALDLNPPGHDPLRGPPGSTSPLASPGARERSDRQTRPRGPARAARSRARPVNGWSSPPTWRGALLASGRALASGIWLSPDLIVAAGRRGRGGDAGDSQTPRPARRSPSTTSRSAWPPVSGWSEASSSGSPTGCSRTSGSPSTRRSSRSTPKAPSSTSI